MEAEDALVPPLSYISSLMCPAVWDRAGLVGGGWQQSFIYQFAGQRFARHIQWRYLYVTVEGPRRVPLWRPACLVTSWVFPYWRDLAWSGAEWMRAARSRSVASRWSMIAGRRSGSDRLNLVRLKSICPANARTAAIPLQVARYRASSYTAGRSLSWPFSI